MKEVKRNRFLVWLMYFVAFFCTGPIGIALWTGAQLYKYNQEKKEYEYSHTPIRKRVDIIEINKKENLTNEDKAFMKNRPNLVKIGKTMGGCTIYLYDRE